MIRPENLVPGDTIALIAPAKAIEPDLVDAAVVLLETAGYKVLVGKHTKGQYHYFSGTDDERAADLQWAIDHPAVKAIVCARGGYGAVRLLDRVQWANFLREPKWLLGFSDITNFHLHAMQLDIESVHCTMPLNFSENSPEAVASMLTVLKTGTVQHAWPNEPINRIGEASGLLVGGNLSILYAALGTPLRPNFQGAILFVEDIGEQLYQLDRMFHALKMAGAFDQIAGLIVGGMTDIKDTAIPTGFDITSMILSHVQYRSIPVVFNAPIGHISDNRAVIVGRYSQLNVTDEAVRFEQ
ncbi:MAG: LD-carboxypeptidase [Moraxellaceae bacterium]